MTKTVLELAQELAIATATTILILFFVVAWISMFVVAGLKLMFRIMDKIEKGDE